MKIVNHIFLGSVLIAGLASCEMKDELTGNTGKPQEMGRLSLDVTVKSETGSKTRAGNETTDFPVSIMQGENEVKYFNTYADLLNAGPVELPVGTYTVVASSPGEMPPISDFPYFGGNKNVTIEKGTSTAAEVLCKMQNIKVALNLSTEFSTAFPTWSITVANGTSIKTLTSVENSSPTPFYFKVHETAVSKIPMTITGTTTAGIKVQKTYYLTKGNSGSSGDGSSENFEGGDFLNINLTPTDVDPGENPKPGVPGVGIKVELNITFAGSDETIEVEVEDGTTIPDPEDPGKEDEKPTLSSEWFDTGVSYSLNGAPAMPESVDVIMDVPRGMKNVIVTILSGNEGFAEVATEMSFDTGRNLVGDTELNELFAGLGMSVGTPDVNATSYVFPVGIFLQLLNIYGPTVGVVNPYGDPCHVFRIKVEDNVGNIVSKDLQVTIME